LNLQDFHSADLFSRKATQHVTIIAVSSPTVSAMQPFRALSLALLVAYASAWQPMTMSTSPGTIKVWLIH